MNNAQVRLLGGLSVALLALSAVLWFYEPADSVRDPEATAAVIDALDPTQSVSIEIVQAAGPRQSTIRLEKDDGMWHVRSPYMASADPERVIALLDGVRESQRGVPVEGAKKSFGLEPPQAVVTVTQQDGSTRVLAVGNAAPVGYRTYVLAADGTAAAVSGMPGEHLMLRDGEYRDHRVFRYDPGAVTRVAVDSYGGLLEATKTDSGWFLTNYGPVDLDQLDDWLTGLLNLRVDLFLDLENTEIADARYTVEVETAEGVQKLWVGKDTPYGPLVLFGDGLDGVVDPNLLEQLKRRPSAVGASLAFPFDPERDTAIVVSGAVSKRVERSDTWMMEPVVTVLANATFTYVGPDDRTLPSPPWSLPELTLVIEGPMGVRSVEIGPVTDGFRAVRDANWPTAVRVPAEELSDLFLP